MSEAAWQPPAELLRSPPRPVRLTRAGKAAAGAAVALAVAALSAGVWLYILADRDAARLKLARSEGVATQAEVVQVGRAGGRDSRRVITYRYAAGGREYQGRARLRQRDRRSVATGSRIVVEYLPSDPALSWIPGYEPGGVPMWAAAVVPLGLGLGLALIVFTQRRQARLLSCGRPAQARVTGSHRVRHGGAHGSHYAWRVEYEFKILSGAARRGWFDQTKDPPAAGASLTIIYDPEEPRRHARYPLSLYRVE